jgi:uncharacterized protein (TIGR02058 family)
VLRRYLIEMGHGIDQHGQDPTRAAQRAVKDAISRSYLTGLREIVGIESYDDVVVRVKVAVPYPEKVRADEVLAPIPFTNKSLEVVEGGMVVEGSIIPELGDTTPEILFANAAVTVYVEG